MNLNYDLGQRTSSLKGFMLCWGALLDGAAAFASLSLRSLAQSTVILRLLSPLFLDFLLDLFVDFWPVFGFSGLA